MKRFILPIIVLLALILRVVWIDRYPVGFTADEASFGYDAYSILKTGRDQWGQRLPLVLRSFGDFKLPLYTYLAIPSVAVFGLSDFSVRLPNVIIGTLAVLVTYLLVYELFYAYKKQLGRINRQNVALTAALLLAISPWHIQLSRGAFEASLTTFFLPLGLYTFLRGIQKPKWFIVSALSLSLNLYSYHSARLVTPVIVVFLLWVKRKDLLLLLNKPGVKRWLYSSAFVFVLSFGLSLYQLTFFNSRSSDIAIFNPTGGWGSVSDRRYEADLAGLPDSISRLFSNKYTYTSELFVANYLSYFSPKFLFLDGVNNGTYGMVPGIAVLYLIELPFLLVAVWYLISNGLIKQFPIKLLCLWILLSPIPAALTKGSGYAGNRSAIMMPAIQIFSALGAVVLFGLLNRKFPKFILLSFSFLVAVVSFVLFFEEYIYHARWHVADQMLYGRKEVTDFIKPIEGNYNEIVFSRSLSESQIFIAFYNKWDPYIYQKETKNWLKYEAERKPFLDQLDGYKLGNYTFGNINYETRVNNGNILLVGKPEDFPMNVSVLNTIYYPNKNPAIFMVER